MHLLILMLETRVIASGRGRGAGDKLWRDSEVTLHVFSHQIFSSSERQTHRSGLPDKDLPTPHPQQVAKPGATYIVDPMGHPLLSRQHCHTG